MNSKSELFTIVLDEFDKLNGKVLSKDLIKKYLDNEDYLEYYAFILHDRDVDEDGIIKYRHYHLVLKCNSRYAKDTIITDVAKNLGCNRSCIKCKAYNDVYSAVQYLIHANDKDKFQYNKGEIISNDDGATMVYLLGEFKIEIDDLIYIVAGAKSLTEVYSTIGIKNSKQYHWVIKDIYNDLKAGVIK